MGFEEKKQPPKKIEKKSLEGLEALRPGNLPNPNNSGNDKDSPQNNSQQNEE